MACSSLLLRRGGLLPKAPNVLLDTGQSIAHGGDRVPSRRYHGRQRGEFARRADLEQTNPFLRRGQLCAQITRFPLVLGILCQ